MIAALRRLLLPLLAFGLGAAGATETKAAIVIPVEIDQNLVIAKVRVGESAPLSFLVDSGASQTVLASRLRARLGLAAGRSVSGSAQGGEIDADLVEGVDIHVGAAVLRPDAVAAIDLGGLEAGLGRRIDGILGYELFAQYRVQIDYRHRRMRLYGPHERLPEGIAIPIEIRGNTPFVRARLDQGGRIREASLLIDTGATGALTLYAAFVSAHPELLPANALDLVSGALLPGRFRSKVGRIVALQLGPFRFRDALTSFSSSGGADDDLEGSAGQIGGELLSRFTVTIDYAGRRMILVPSADLGRRIRFDAAGASFRATGEALDVKEVRAVLPGTPAETTGLRVGDILKAVDGKPVGAISLGRLRAMLREPGRLIRLLIERDGKTQILRLRTRTLI